MRRTAIALPALLLLAAGCGRVGGPTLEQPVGETHTTASSTGGGRRLGTDTASEAVAVVLDDDIRRACDLPKEPHEAPRFDFDSARLKARGDDILAHLASCISAGKLGDSTLEIIGHTDPRGAPDYSKQLGLYRAEAAKDHLVSLGVPPSRIGVESHGAIDAKGADETTWALDRRIEIHRVTTTRAP